MTRPLLLGIVASLVIVVAACGEQPPTPVPVTLHVENRTGDTFIVEIDRHGTDGTPAYAVGLPACGGAWDIRSSDAGLENDDWQVFALVADAGDLGALVPAGPLKIDGTPPVVDMSIAWSTGEIRSADLPRAITIRPDGVGVTPVRDPTPIAPGCEPWLGKG